MNFVAADVRRLHLYFRTTTDCGFRGSMRELDRRILTAYDS
jgi:hypothetical protein